MYEKSIKVMKVAIVFLLNICIILLISNMSSSTVTALSKYGSRGEEVRRVQTKLKEFGYYTDKIDGIFGKNTLAAVKRFQKAKGLTQDGIVGPITLKALGLSSNTGTPSNVKDSDYKLLARLISAESRAEPYIGQVAVGAVILNRIKHPSFPDTLAGVAYQPGAFTAMTDGQIDKPVIESAYKAARDALNGWDPSGGAIYYYNPAKTTNQWMFNRPVIKRIGKHVFCS